MRRPAILLLTAVLVLGGCAESGDEVPDATPIEQPESRDDGIQATGILDGARVAISRGNPIVVIGDCDANDGLDEDICIVGRTIDGLPVNLVIENPAALEAGRTIPIEPCASRCDDVTGSLVVEVRVDGDARQVQRGSLDVTQAGPRYAARFDLVLPFGDRLVGSFDVDETTVEETTGDAPVGDAPVGDAPVGDEPTGE